MKFGRDGRGIDVEVVDADVDVPEDLGGLKAAWP